MPPVARVPSKFKRHFVTSPSPQKLLITVRALDVNGSPET